MALRSTHIRLGETLYRELREAAERDGVSLAEYIRGAAVERLARERERIAAAERRSGRGDKGRSAPQT